MDGLNVNNGGEEMMFTYARELFDNYASDAIPVSVDVMLECFTDLMDLCLNCDNLDVTTGGSIHPGDFILTMIRFFVVNIAPSSIEISLDEKFMQNVFKLCKARRKMVRSWDIYDAKCLVDVYFLFGQYHFWIKYNRDKAVKYMHRGINIAKKHGLTEYLRAFTVSLLKMENAVGNYGKSLKLIKWQYDLGHLTQREYSKRKKRCKGLFGKKKPFQILDTKEHKRKIVYCKQMQLNFVEYPRDGGIDCDVVHYREIVLNKVKPYFMNGKCFNIMNNLVKLKHCNYIECNRKDLRRFKVCKRCKSAFYCCRRHQKLDWNRGGHKTYCSERQKRDYQLLQESVSWRLKQFNIED